MDITRAGSLPSAEGNPDWFTGTVRVDPLFKAPDPARAAAANITVEPGARTAWHGASPATAMTHIAVQEYLDDKAVDWLEKVSDEQYEGSA